MAVMYVFSAVFCLSRDFALRRRRPVRESEEHAKDAGRVCKMDGGMGLIHIVSTTDYFI